MIATTLEVPVAYISLKHARAQIGLTQQQLADEAKRYLTNGDKVSVSVVRNCEQGIGNISLRSAYALLNALNRVRTERGLSGLGLRDIDWNIRE